ncbi:MAG TPA: tetratricopeptide repeat protein [Bryobacteraceae bacterium]|nr:tetratricopeptide repeat protein [Bryobacteraceae bacterium]
MDPENRDAWTELGFLLADSRRFPEAAVCFHKVANNGASAINNPKESVRLMAEIASARPAWVRGQFSLACAYEHLVEHDLARQHLANSLRLDPSLRAAVEARHARMLWREEKSADAIAAADRALKTDPNCYLALVIRGEACSAQYRMPEAVGYLRRSLEMAPDAVVHSDLLFAMNYLPETTPETLYAEACRWNALYAAPLASEIQPHANPPDPERRLKVGYVSPDLYSHAIAKFMLPVIEFHDRSRYEVFAYSLGSESDDVTDRFRALVEHFVALPPEGKKLADRIRADGIDILVDLAGHTTGQAYLAFARKPAPVQVSWLGTLSTTGMPAMDYFLGDAEMPCPGTEHLFTETVYRLKRVFCCYRSGGLTTVSPAPCLERGDITFGSFNSPRKITREVVKLWSQILHLASGSRLLLKYHRMEEEARQAPLLAWFAEDGIPGQRILFAGRSKSNDYLLEYGRIDIALDPFPYNGGSTTLDALWMGVPVVTLAGRSPVQRTGACLLTAAGLPHLVTHSPEQYVATAVLLAQTVPSIPDFRLNLRKALETSPLMDEQGLVRSVEDAFREMWRTWCNGKECRARNDATRIPIHDAPENPTAARLIAEGNRLRETGDWINAEESYKRATEIDPENRDAWTELGVLQADSRRFSEAAVTLRNVSGTGASAADDSQESVRLLAEIAEARPDWVRGQYSLGCAYEHLVQHDRARQHLANALQLDSSKLAAVEALYARMFWTEERYTDAIAAADRSLAANPDYYLALVIRGRACSAEGRMAEAVHSMRRSLEIVPDASIHSSMLFDMTNLAETSAEMLYADACRWNALYSAPLASEIQPHLNQPDPERRLKLGYVSPDLYGHPIAKFVMPVFELHDRSRFEVFAYAVGTKSDHITECIRARVEHFVTLPAKEREVAERIRTDGIDILVDLAGHTTGDAYLAFARKPAPVQVSWLGVLSTTGMSTMDYFLGDAEMPCPGTEHLFTETIYRLPRAFCCYQPGTNASVAPAPYRERGDVTFGCYNSPRKITREVVKLWSAILHLVRGSRLLLKFHNMEEEVRQAPLLAWFAEDGIPSQRILFAGGSLSSDYFQEYGRIDIALDPFPYNGGSTTLDALWMGVPVVTLAGRSPVQRTGACLLTAAGLPDLVTHSPEQYVTTAVFLAQTLPKIPDSRVNLRKALQSSPLMDEVGLVRSVEAAFRDMWRIWCRTRN